MGHCLVIGYGNTLRSDDGVGPQVAELVAAWQLPEVRSRVVHQLAPELAAEMAEVETVIFVDAAAPDAVLTGVTVSSIDLSGTDPYPQRLGHTSDPRSLLFLTQHLYQARPTAYWVLLPTENLDFGEQFSPLAEAGIESALNEIRKIVLSGKRRKVIGRR